MNLDTFFLGLMNFGKFPDKTRAYVFSKQRQYFDQVIYKNKGFRHEYAIAYAAWLDCLGKEKELTQKEILVHRINEGIRQTGEEIIEKLFSGVTNVVRSQCKDGQSLPELLDYHHTLPDGEIDKDSKYKDVMNTYRRFWMRIAVPEVREEEF